MAAKTKAQLMRESRQRRRDAGMRCWEVWVTEEEREQLVLYLKATRSCTRAQRQPQQS